MGILVGVFLSGNLNGWWSLPSARDSRESESLAAAEPPIISTFATAAPVTAPAKLPNQPVAKAAPNFTLPDLIEESLTYTLAQYEGRPIILNFWASWCLPCRTEMPALQRAHEKYSTEGLVILAINQTYSDDLEAARSFAVEMGLTFPLLRDAAGDVSEKDFKVRGLPTTIIIYPDGTIATTRIGQMSDVQIEEFSQQLVAGEMIP